jgi:hypothetical protein
MSEQMMEVQVVVTDMQAPQVHSVLALNPANRVTAEHMVLVIKVVN